MQAKVVAKFGGSNLKNPEDVKRIIQVIENYNQPMVIVVSAFFGVTNYLINSLQKAIEGQQVAEEVYTYLLNMKKEAIDKQISDTQNKQETLDEIECILTKLRNLLTGVQLTGDASPALCDLIQSYGERLSATFLNGALKENKLDAELALPENIGLVTDGEFGNASVNFEASKENVDAKLNADNIFVVPGFYGISPKGKITLLGRGGSDYSAASIAKCVGASSLDIWKDVNGFMSCDPKLVKSPVRINKLGYAEAAELAYFGAKILHPRTVEPLTEDKIGIRLFNIYGELDVNAPLSVVNGENHTSEDVIKSVTYSREFGILKLKGPGVGIKPGILAKVTTALHNEGINISSVITSQISINILIDKKQLTRAKEVVSKIKLPTVSELLALKNVSAIAAVGQGLVDNYGVAARIFKATAESEVNVVMSCSGASPVVSYFLVEEKDLETGIRAIHKEFFE